MSKGRTDANDKDQEDLQEAKATVLLQQKQLINYEKLIKKQNYKIQTLRKFIMKHHGKDTLEKLESCTTTEPIISATSTKKPTHVYSATTGTRITPNHNNINATERKHLNSDHTNTNSSTRNKNKKREIDNNSNNNSINNSEKRNGDSMINIRLGANDMHSFFFCQSDIPRPLMKPDPQSPTQWETITSSLSIDHQPPISDINSSPSSQTTNDSSSPSSHSIKVNSPPIISTKTSIAVSPFSNGHHIPSRISSSPTNNKRKLESFTNTQSNKHRLSKDTLWETFSSPSPPEIDLLHNTSTAKATNRLHTSHNKQPTNQRHILAPVSQNQSIAKQNNDTTLDKIRDQIITKPAPDSEFPYEEVVRKKDERAKLHGSTCTCCEKYFESNGNPTSLTTTHERIQRYSRHRERYVRPKTPPGYWDLDFPPSPQK